ncbi:type II toxin-antitoxin system RelE family toxin [Cellulomonas marina]|uniref:mRNA-degrading endonuclease RelE, toxin component of the RelBE toxin-antitoxin system n=1 Tax=Cellulomonas marina TaxID=988821 RepID=A0A1I1AFV0_9CELL|nr:type II toxin-antitoxin system RelE/ParE family toxin [Cellulomonas marina]GIG30213.1 toxin RelG [Cellulomonas marina]SFB36905.1 mRNA-degrading endonuclease RelE, toxin component of the RelBE toxin-antitoxin system [Cellulomonas marina]
MSYRVELAPRARREITRLPNRVVPAVVEFLDVIAENPFRVSKALHPPLDHLRSARRGAYRILFEVDDEEKVVVVARVDHRADVYRP